MAFTKPKRNPAERGYGNAHLAERKRRLAAYHHADPCCYCGVALGTNTSRIHLPHRPDRSGYEDGLAHARCNTREAARRGRAMQLRGKRVQQHFPALRPDPQRRSSLTW